MEGVKRYRERRAEYLALPEHLRNEAEHRDRQQRRRELADAVSAELDVLFAPSRKHVHERKEWVAVAKVDDRQSGDGPIDLEAGVVELPRIEDQDQDFPRR